MFATGLWREHGGGRSAGLPTGRYPGVDLEERITAFTSGLDRHGRYRQPDREERRAAAEGLGLLLDGRPREAGKRLAGAGLHLTGLTDRATGRRYAEISEAADTGDSDSGGGSVRGWGRAYVDLSAPARWSVQVPHPVADTDSERLGVGVLRGASGGVLVLAGAHREAGEDGAADVAHRRDTVFHALCDELVDRRMPGIQVHGFADDSVPGTDAVVSTGRGRHGLPQARGLARALRAQGLEVCRAWARSCELEGRTNVQGRRAAAEEVPFLHLEFSRSVRTDRERTEQVAAATAAVAADWS
ncbi:hypothetical protein GQS52_04310 [Streptomyces sp. SCUT-3]|uniref:hypothetical protein n=1 Tax=Streptomyces sp. SCUT-3 TaxID=2684469 RepID=UPI000CC9B1BC|nr:hypothetical protein [Streptomyces sp. SCUT-3]PLW71678.1 hypothetical protein C0036_16570 [Streptomyces sp. DJ]QMV21121.1 hypothetical protein GQS52_04310 [Streptomyces sp. SCUT-3]